MLPKFEFFGEVFFTYPLLMGVAWGIAVQMARRLNLASSSPLQHLNFYLIGLFITSWTGAKVFYALTADFEYKNSVLAHSDFWFGGGFVFYGGLVFGLAFTFLFGIKTRQPMPRFNIFVPALAIGHALGRVGCFLAGCCYGLAHEGPLSIPLQGVERLPTQLFEAAALLVFCLVALRPGALVKKNLIMNYFLFYAVTRFLLEFLRADAVRGVWFMGVSTSQIVSIILMLGLASFYVFKAKSRGLCP
ncbi:MAG: prolipoprotein diacylglyceryl transferase family protein [Bacteriovoracaceae bacterium]